MSTEITPAHRELAADLAAASEPPRIVFDDVVKKFGDTTVLQDLNFSVERGERVTLIGPSGSGKTTILRLVMTLEELTGGFIYVDGQPLTHEIRGDSGCRASASRSVSCASGSAWSSSSSTCSPT